MAERTDILLDDSFQLIEDAETFDFVEGESDTQHVQLMLLSEVGENKQYPFAGWGANSRLKKRFDREEILRSLNVELTLDGYKNATIELGASILELKISI